MWKNSRDTSCFKRPESRKHYEATLETRGACRHLSAGDGEPGPGAPPSASSTQAGRVLTGAPAIRPAACAWSRRLPGKGRRAVSGPPSGQPCGSRCINEYVRAPRHSGKAGRANSRLGKKQSRIHTSGRKLPLVSRESGIPCGRVGPRGFWDGRSRLRFLPCKRVSPSWCACPPGWS